MSDYRRCPKCGAHDDLSRHNCPPIFEVQQIDEDPANDEWSHVHALDEEGAAENWAENDDSNSAEYSIVRGTPEKVRVRRLGETSFKVFAVRGEYDPVYWATEVDEEKEDPRT